MKAIKGFIARHQFTEVSDGKASEGTETKPVAPSVSAIDDELFKTSLSAALMKSAEVTQPWSTIGVDQWIESGRWWLLRAQMELYAVTVSQQKVPLAAYTSLIKASWILVDIIACHPQKPYIKANTHSEVQLLSRELKNEFSRLSALQSIVPDLSELEGQDLRIWETQERGPLLRPHKDSRRLDEWTVGGGEQVLFQRFALCKLHEVTESLPCILLFLVRENGQSARIITQNQNGAIMMAVSFQTPLQILESDSSVSIKDVKIMFNTVQDVQHFGCLIEATNFYYFGRKANRTSLEDLKAYVLITAIKNQKKDVIEQLLQRISTEKDALESDFDGSPVIVASMLASQRIADQLIKSSESETQGSIRSLHFWAFRCGLAPLVKVLLIEHPTVDEKEWQGMTPLGVASSCGYEPVVSLLIGSGTDVQAIDRSGWAAIHHACFQGHEEVARLLLRSGTDVQTIDSSGRTALHYACSQGHEGVVRLLLRSGTDIQAIDSSGRTALHFACSHGHEGVVRLLLRGGADVGRITNTYKQSALHFAARNGHKNVIPLLIEGGADIEAEDHNGFTPLCKLCSKFYSKLCATTSLNQDAVIALLLEKGANVNQRNKYGMNATYYALRSKMSESTVRAILAKQLGGRDNIRDDARMQREKVVLELDADWAAFYLDSPNAVIEMPKDIPSNVECAYNKMISIERPSTSEEFPPLKFPPFEVEFMIVHNQDSLDFSIETANDLPIGPNGWFNIKIGSVWKKNGEEAFVYEDNLSMFTGVKLGETALRSSAEDRLAYR